MPQILPDDEIVEGINSLNPKQKEAFNAVHKLVKEYVKCNGHNDQFTYFFRVVEALANLIW